jgi:hypothetical protein
LPNKWFIWPSSFRGDDCLEINQSETRIAYGGHVCYELKFSWKHSWKVFYKDCSFSFDPLTNMATTGQGCFLPSFDSFGKAVSEEKIF